MRGAQRDNPAAQQQQLATPCMCAHSVPSLCCGELFVLEPAICNPTIPHISGVLPLLEHVHQLRHFGRKHKELLNINLDTKPSLCLRPERQYFYVHTTGNTFCRRF